MDEIRSTTMTVRIAQQRFESFDQTRRIAEAKQADADDIAELAQTEKQLQEEKRVRRKAQTRFQY